MYLTRRFRMDHMRYKVSAHAPKLFYEQELEPCEIVVSFFQGIKDHPPTEDQHQCAWQHVRCCFTCLRNVARVLFIAGHEQMPLPITHDQAEKLGLVDAPEPSPHAN